MSNLVKLMITIENDEQADKVLEVLKEAEEQGELDFPFDVERQDGDTIKPTFGDKNNPLI